MQAITKRAEIEKSLTVFEIYILKVKQTTMIRTDGK